MPSHAPISLVEALHGLPLLQPRQQSELTRLQDRFPEPLALARELIRLDWLTPYQANQIFRGRAQELILGSYLLLERLGEGGMGMVYKARHVKMGRIAAVKVIRKERLQKANAVRRFYREVRAAAQQLLDVFGWMELATTKVRRRLARKGSKPAPALHSDRPAPA